MGRPWWYDNYWQKERPPKRRFRRPGRRTLVWLSLVLVSLLIAFYTNGFQFAPVPVIIGFVSIFCRLLSFAVLVRALLSWFRTGYSLPVMMLDDLTDPLLYPLRRAIPPLGGLDFSPLIAILLLSFIPSLFARLVYFFVR